MKFIDWFAGVGGFRRNTQTYDPDGITETIDTAGGGVERCAWLALKLDTQEWKGNQESTSRQHRLSEEEITKIP